MYVALYVDINIISTVNIFLERFIIGFIALGKLGVETLRDAKMISERRVSTTLLDCATARHSKTASRANRKWKRRMRK